MKKVLSILLIAVLCLTLVPSTASAAVKINYKSAVVIEGDYLYLEITGTKSKPTWKSGNEYKASVLKSGKVITKDVGIVKITGSVNKKKYICKITIIPNIDPNYKTDTDVDNELAERDYIDNFSGDSTVDPNDIVNEDSDNENSDNVSSSTLSDMLRYGFASSEDMETEIGQAYLKFCKEWASEYELKNHYGVTLYNDAYSNKIYLIIDVDKKYILENAPSKFISGAIYTNSNVQYQYLDKFTYEGNSFSANQLYFNKDDLIKAGVIKQK